MNETVFIDFLGKGSALAAALYMLWHVFNRFTNALVEEFKGMRQDLRENTAATERVLERTERIVERLARVEKGQDLMQRDTPWPPMDAVSPASPERPQRYLAMPTPTKKG